MSLNFLMCSERSGSNFVTKLLNGHSAVCGPSTKHIFNPVIRNLFRYEPLDHPSNWDSLLTDIQSLLDVPFSIWEHSFKPGELRKLAPEGDIAQLLERIFYAEAEAHGKEHLFIKENQLYEFFPFLLIHYPASRYLYQVRDPRDMALSWKKNPAHPGGVIKAARQWKKDQQQYLKLFRELEREGAAVMIRYEDLIENPEEELEKMLSLLGLVYEEGMLSFHQDRLTQKNAETQQAWKNLSRGVLSGNKNKYRSELSEEEVRSVEKICYHEMKLLGYLPEFSPTELSRVTDIELELAEKRELDEIRLQRPEGVTANMEIKKRMYRRPV
ncbi:MAG: sulfotransferase [Balneolaceae bacterium]